MHLKVGGAYIKLLPRTLATLVSMSDGRSVENAIDELNRNFKESVYADGYIVVDIGALQIFRLRHLNTGYQMPGAKAGQQGKSALCHT